jgi:hypothetical protein
LFDFISLKIPPSDYFCGATIKTCCITTMQFKIDAKEQFTVITPQNDVLDSLLTADLAVECQLLVSKGSENFIIDLQSCQSIQNDFLLPMIELAAKHYEQGQSFVLTNFPPEMQSLLKTEDAIDSLNCAPSFIEAIDIVNMEILERDLFNEE